MDDNTRGDWQGKYGADGYELAAKESWMNEFLSSHRSPFVMHTHPINNPTRRTFLKTGLAATLGTSAMWAQATTPVRKLRIAGVGIGGMGGANLGNVAGEEIWVAACKGNGPASSDFAYAVGLTELTHLGNLAIHLGGRIDWDAAACQATNRPEAAALIRMPRRPGWELPD